MSVVVGLGNGDMTVLCADRQMTDSQAGLKFEGSKVRCFESAEWIKLQNIAFAYCGPQDMADTLFDSVIKAVGSAVEDASDCDLLDGEYFRQHLLPVFRSKDARGMETLIGLQTKDYCLLFKTKADQVVAGGIRECIVGGGDSSVLRYISDIVSRTEIDIPEMALPFAIYMVMLANRYVDGCGFGVDAVVLEAEKPPTFLGKTETAKYSEQFAQFERQMEKEFFAGAII